MKEPSGRAWRASAQCRWLMWLACVAMSTAVLVGPSLAQALRRQIDTGDNPQLDQRIYLLSKTFHVADYALLAVLTGWLLAPRRLRGLLLLFLSAHAMGTELLQRYVETRTGAWEDVGFDHLGLVLGLALTWKWWLPPAPVDQALAMEAVADQGRGAVLNRR